MTRNLPQLLAVARGDAPADLLLSGGRVVNVFSGEIESADVAISQGLIAGVGPGYAAKETIDLHGAFVSPGWIDAHVHIESSLCTPPQFARAVVPRGVTTVVTDPHEIANVAGARGVQYMVDASRGLPLGVVVMAPSCVPATAMGTSGAVLSSKELSALRGSVQGLAEVMNFPGVIHGDGEVLAKLAGYNGRPIDGHAPGVVGRRLNAYIAAGIGSDHECVAVDEAREKLARGLYILIREATNARNLQPLLPLINSKTGRRICLCTDDRQPADLLGDGGIDHMLRTVIAAGVDPVEAVRLATLNPCEWFGLPDRGAIAPGRRADIVVFDNLQVPVARLVFTGGRLAARDGIAVDWPVTVGAEAIASQCNIRWDQLCFAIPATSPRVRVIGSVEGQLVTHALTHSPPQSSGLLESDVAADVLKMAVIERHRGTGNVGLGFIRGFGLQRGAIAGTVAHDHHNLVVIGVDDESMHTASRAAAEDGGGLAVASGQTVLHRLPLPVAGLMSDGPIEQVRDSYARLLTEARTLGSPMHDPFMAMSFMALEVIPSLKLTDRGLVDVERFKVVGLFV